MEDAVFELKKLKRCIGEVPDCTDDQLKSEIVDCAASFDASWNSRGWSARDGVVAAISDDTGKVLDAYIKWNGPLLPLLNNIYLLVGRENTFV